MSAAAMESQQNKYLGECMGMRDRPNIIYIMSDDHAANAISAYGSRLSQVFHTPNIDRLAEEGAIFTSCHCTNAICTPSRATILT